MRVAGYDFGFPSRFTFHVSRFTLGLSGVERTCCRMRRLSIFTFMKRILITSTALFAFRSLLVCSVEGRVRADCRRLLRGLPLTALLLAPPAALRATDAPAPAGQATIDRHALVTRHNITWNTAAGRLPLGNGEFCFGADGTGLQTFAGNSSPTGAGTVSRYRRAGLPIGFRQPAPSRRGAIRAETTSLLARMPSALGCSTIRTS